MRRQGLAGTLVETERVIQQEFRESARRKPRKAAFITQASKSQASIPIETVPPEKR
jgi:hypothetical protein